MIRNYLKTAWRNMLRNRTFSVINIVGLGLGLAFSLLILLWVNDERSVDSFHKNKAQLFQVYERNYYDGKVEASYPTQGLLAQELKKTIPEIQYSSGLELVSAPGTKSTFEAGEKIEKMFGVFAGADFFNMFSFPLLQGNSANALNKPSGIAISRKMAEHFFGSTDKAMGQIINFENKEQLMVTAVFENIPSNSSLQFDFLRSWTDFVSQNEWVNNWGNSDPSTYVQLHKDADAAKVEAKIKDFIYRYQKKDNSFRVELALQPFSEKYLHSSFKNGNIDGGRIEYVRMFTWVAIFILLIACINFMNLATAQSAKRAKEVGLRKVIGALRSSLIRQFIGEAMLMTFFSIMIAIVLANLLIPIFNNISGKDLSIPFSKPVFWFTIAALLVGTGLVAGSYPAFFLSSMNPIRVLKGSLKFGRGALFFRKGLVVFQFALSTILIVGTLTVYQQMSYIQTKNIGYDRENLVYIPIEGELIKKYSVFKDEATRIPGVLSISKMRNSPTIIQHHTTSINWPGMPTDLTLPFADAVVGYDFVKTMKLELKEGRDFSREFRTDSASFLLNETAAQRMGFKNPVGQSITWGKHQGQVIGVMKDFHFSSLHQSIDPLIVRLDENWTWGTILVRVKPNATKEVMAGLSNIHKSLNPKFPFTYQFSDLEFTKLYQSEEVIHQLSRYFAILAIFISCLGLFGLAAFTAEQRTKEIGIRKVLGASVNGVVVLLSKDFISLVSIAVIIAVPIAWYATHVWLQDFAYQVNISWSIFVLAAVAAIVIAMLTISTQAIRAAMTNPARSLRAE